VHFFTDTKSHQGRALWIHPWRVNLEYQQLPSDYKYQVNEGMLWRIELGHSSWNGICPSSLLTGPHPRGLYKMCILSTKFLQIYTEQLY